MGSTLEAECLSAQRRCKTRAARELALACRLHPMRHARILFGTPLAMAWLAALLPAQGS